MNINDTGSGLPCRGCIHFFMTYHSAFPYGCRAMGFKSRKYPCIEVRAATGAVCGMRESRVGDAGGEAGKAEPR